MRADAAAVVIGGGVAGCSIAYHLARLGWTDVVVVEQHDLADGTTWHSAGFVGQLRSTISQTRMIMYSSSLYAELRERTGLDPGWRGVGGLRLATTPERVEELRRQVSSATTYGLDMTLLTPAETADAAAPARHRRRPRRRLAARRRLPRPERLVPGPRRRARGRSASSS